MGKSRQKNKTKWSMKKARIHHKVIFTLTGVIGVVLVWRGMWSIFDSVPFVSNPWFSVALGFLLVIASGIFFRLI